MRTIKCIALIITFVMMIGLSGVSAQDFSASLDAVERIEVDIKQMVKAEAQARATEMNKLRASMGKCKPLWQKRVRLQRLITPNGRSRLSA